MKKYTHISIEKVENGYLMQVSEGEVVVRYQEEARSRRAVATTDKELLEQIKNFIKESDPEEE